MGVGFSEAVGVRMGGEGRPNPWIAGVEVSQGCALIGAELSLSSDVLKRN